MANETQTATKQETQGAQPGGAGQRQGQDRNASEGRRDQSQGSLSRRPDDRHVSLVRGPFALLQRFFTDDVPSLFDQLSGSASTARSGGGQATSAISAWMPKID